MPLDELASRHRADDGEHMTRQSVAARKLRLLLLSMLVAAAMLQSIAAAKLYDAPALAASATNLPYAAGL